METSLNLISQLKTSTKKIILNLFVEVFYVVLGFTILVLACLFLMYGIANGLGQAFHGQQWLGYTVTGTLGMIIGSVIFFTRGNRCKKDKMPPAPRVNEEFNLSAFVQRHPFYSTSAAAAAGFFVGEDITVAGKSAVISLMTAVGEDIAKNIFVAESS